MRRPARTWRQAIRRFDPDLSVLLVGAWEALDFIADGHVYVHGTPEHSRALVGIVNDAIAPLLAARPTCGAARSAALRKPQRRHAIRIATGRSRVGRRRERRVPRGCRRKRGRHVRLVGRRDRAGRSLRRRGRRGDRPCRRRAHRRRVGCPARDRPPRADPPHARGRRARSAAPVPHTEPASRSRRRRSGERAFHRPFSRFAFSGSGVHRWTTCGASGCAGDDHAFNGPSVVLGRLGGCASSRRNDERAAHAGGPFSCHELARVPAA